MTEPVLRVGGRVLLVDPDGRVLLIHERIEIGEHWLTPGGGVEDDEQPRHAAVRETLEETGIALEVADDAEPVLVTRRDWSWAGVSYDQTDHFFVAHLAEAADVVPHALTELERQTLIGHRWWTVDELRSTAETIEPPQLVDVLAALLAGRAPSGEPTA